MSICYLNNDYEKKYRCEYRTETDIIKVDVEYDIGEEIELKNGVRTWDANTVFKNRDILIIDSDKKKSYLLKDAYYNGSFGRYGAFEEKNVSSFASGTYFSSNQIEKLMNLPIAPRTKRIKLYSKMVDEYNRHPSVNTINSDESYSIIMTKKEHKRVLDIKENNIKQIAVGDDWGVKLDLSEISVRMTSYIEIELSRRVKYTDIYSYVYEIMVFMQLLRPGKFLIDRIVVDVDGGEYDFSIRLLKPDYTDRPVELSSRMDMLEFLKRCYSAIPYRNSENYIRNIAYIIMYFSRNIEDGFLMFYRFIECYYKRQSVKFFINEGIKKHYKQSPRLTEQQIEQYTQEIICLRNHYTHSGYYIKNSSLKIKFGKKEDPRNYIAKADYEWIYNRTKMLYLIAIDIIFVDMLGISNYQYKKTI